MIHTIYGPIDSPKFKEGTTVEIKGSRYSFRIDTVILKNGYSWIYRGQMLKDSRPYSYGTITERALLGV